MNKNIILKGIAGLLIAGSLVSCSEDYLDVKPITSIDTSTVTSTTEGAQSSIYGICTSMWYIYSNFDVSTRFFTGEASLMTFYGEVPSPDYFSMEWARSGADFMNWEYMNRDQYIPTYVGWMYCYNLISQANTILSGIDEASGTEADRDYIKAQALTFRAHAYTQLMKIYGPRWEDSRNGERYALVERLTPGVGDAPFVTINQTMKQIYADLDEAIELYKSSGKNRGNIWEPNIDVARGIYARAAMVKNDYGKAREMASLARKNYPIMSADEYRQGFLNANAEYMWANALDYNNTGYWSWGTINACNGSYVSFWGNGSGMISYDLLKTMSDDDIRVPMFWSPRSDLGSGSLTPAAFWNGDVVNVNNMNCNANKQMQIRIAEIGAEYKANIPGSSDELFADSYSIDAEAGGASDIVVPFGAHFKFWGAGVYSISQFPFMRGAEMLLIEAEAAFRLGDQNATRTLLTELNSKRHTDPYDISTLSGDDLWNEYTYSSRYELWGEGHTWFNMKRWRVTATRREWIEGDTNSNNIPNIYKSSHAPEAENGWRWTVPFNETNMNKGANRQLLNY